MALGKRVGSKIYVHKKYMKYAGIILDWDIYYQIVTLDRYLPNFNCIRYDRKTNEIALQYSKDFDTSDEPEVTETVFINENGMVRTTKANPDNPQIWHRKELWVGTDYKGFNYQKAAERTTSYVDKLTAYDRPRIGYLKYWNEVKKRIGIK